jgi:hypothetical protein
MANLTFVSQPAVNRVVGHHIENNFEFEDFADTYQAGDGVLGKD